MSGTAIGVKFTRDSGLPKFIPWIADGKLKMSFKVGEHCATSNGGLHPPDPIPGTSIYGDLPETFTCVSVWKAEERASDSGDGFWV